MKVKVSEATGAALDWMVNEAQGYNTPPLIVYDGCERGDRNRPRKYLATEGGFTIDYSNWAQGGPIIEREGIEFTKAERFETRKLWLASMDQKGLQKGMKGRYQMLGQTPLIAAMRCYVASKLGDEVEVPEELQ